ncbi:MAG: tetratricopeptide repeat protein [Clostridium sartagoforme]|nr:tetratricopeptide repeat protein [Clostridium sartagoforme]
MKNKDYDKALYLYNNGRIEKAIETCERGISRDLSNSKILNLKGILLYLKGDLEDAIAIWNINKDYNNDDIASSYLKDVQNDFNRMELYIKAKGLVDNLFIDEAIDILEICSKSDFNSINVNNLLAICYLKKGNDEKVKENLDKVFKLDINNEQAKIINGKLNSIYKYKNKKDTFLKVMLGVIILATSIVFIKLEGKNLISLNLHSEAIEADNSTIENNESISKEDNKIVIEKSEIENQSEIISIISNEEIRKNYIDATKYYKEGKYEEAKDLLEYTMNKSNNNHLDDDIIFLLASSYEAYGNVDKAIENFDKYILNYKDGSYIKEVYYRAALLYKNIDIKKSKEYANIILISYPDSIYNNSYIEEILNS